ncbi:MAG TPA: S8 family peptidase [Rugosimonospora sp.]|nr:S8 family peptidase [Rugosimonospora sp.]
MRERLLACVLGAAVVAIATTGAAPGYAAASAPTAVIVQCRPGAAAAVAALVARDGGTATAVLRGTDTVLARVPSARLAALRVAPGVAGVTADAQVHLAGQKWQPDGDPFSMYSVDSLTGALAAFGMQDAKQQNLTGRGIGVALIDSGISPVQGLNTPGKIVNGPDLSFESPSPTLRYLDSFGHGTHMAGIIAGRDPGIAAGKEQKAAEKSFVGMAPDATLVNVKVAAADGAVDVSQVIAGIDWVVTHRADPGLNIRVLNLSFGTDSVQDERLDPLSHAVEAAWRNGIVVVAAAGNDGVTHTAVSMPAANPYVIAVGAADSNGTSGRADDLVASFSTGGSAVRHPDLLAPGRSIASLRDPNSYIDVNYPTGLIPNDASQRFFRGSGTSQATAVVSGAAALLLQQRPNLTPDQVKALLTGTATRLNPQLAPLSGNPLAQGAGELDLQAALTTATPVGAAQTWTAATGTGSLEASRGTAFVRDPVTGIELHGEQDIMGQSWTAASWAARESAGTAWTGSVWNHRSWGGAGFTGTDWAGTPWAVQSFTFSGGSWTGRSWTGRSWTGRSWTDGYWSSASWS